jgi:hypothetical protein
MTPATRAEIIAYLVSAGFRGDEGQIVFFRDNSRFCFLADGGIDFTLSTPDGRRAADAQFSDTWPAGIITDFLTITKKLNP